MRLKVRNLKNLINQVYSSQIGEFLKDGNSLIEQNKFNESKEIFNQALRVPNKMYLSDDIDGEISRIKTLE